MPNTHQSRSSKFRSIKIDCFLQREQETKRREVQLLLVGTPNSGKNTITKQLRIHFGDGYPPNERLQLVSTILANLTDTVAQVLRRMQELQVQFADGTARKLASQLLESQPEGGFLSSLFIYQTTPSTSHLFGSTEPMTLGITPPNNHTATILPTVPAEYNRDSLDQPATLGQIIPPSLSVDAAGSHSSPPIDGEDHAFIHETMLHILQNNDSLPPSLMKKFELIADPSVIETLQEALSDRSKLRALYLQLLGNGSTGWLDSSHADSRPPLPSDPPPTSFEDELLDCIVSQDSIATSISLSSSSISGESTDSDNLMKGLDGTDSAPPDSVLTVPNGGHSRRRSRIANTSDVNPNERPIPIEEEIGGQNEALFLRDSKHLYEIRSGVDSEAINQMKSLRLLKIILKLLTEQTEFQEALKGQGTGSSIVDYADCYFIEHVDRIIQEDYIPTLQDILVARQPSKAIREMSTSIGTTVVRTIDVAEQGKYLHKHLHYFESVHTILFLISLSDCLESPDSLNIAQEELETSIQLFETLIFSPHMLKKDFVIFLNKFDLLRKRFGEEATDAIDSDHEERVGIFVERLKQRFLVYKHRPDARGGRLMIHVTCALDVDQMKVTMRECLRGLFESNRKRHPIH